MVWRGHTIGDKVATRDDLRGKGFVLEVPVNTLASMPLLPKRVSHHGIAWGVSVSPTTRGASGTRITSRRSFRSAYWSFYLILLELYWKCTPIIPLWDCTESSSRSMLLPKSTVGRSFEAWTCSELQFSLINIEGGSIHDILTCLVSAHKDIFMYVCSVDLLCRLTFFDTYEASGGCAVEAIKIWDPTLQHQTPR